MGPFPVAGHIYIVYYSVHIVYVHIHLAQQRTGDPVVGWHSTAILMHISICNYMYMQEHSVKILHVSAFNFCLCS